MNTNTNANTANTITNLVLWPRHHTDLSVGELRARASATPIEDYDRAILLGDAVRRAFCLGGREW